MISSDIALTLSFGVAFIIGVSVGQLLKWPIRGALLFTGIAFALYAMVDSAGALAVAESLARHVVAWGLGAMGYPPAWADKLFTPEWTWVLERIVRDITAQADKLLGGTAREGLPLEQLARNLLSRWDIAFLGGALASVRS